MGARRGYRETWRMGEMLVDDARGCKWQARRGRAGAHHTGTLGWRMLALATSTYPKLKSHVGLRWLANGLARDHPLQPTVPHREPTAMARRLRGGRWRRTEPRHSDRCGSPGIHD